MSLATRCTACGTVFRVVQDQLKVSEGWVRCGRCSEVFNALEGLFDLEGSSGPVPLARETDDPVPTALSSPVPEPEPEPALQRTGGEASADDAPTTQIDTRADAPSSFERSSWKVGSRAWVLGPISAQQFGQSLSGVVNHIRRPCFWKCSQDR